MSYILTADFVFMIFDFFKRQSFSLYSLSLILLLGLPASGVHAQSINDRVIPLDVGQWDYHQSTKISGIEVPLASLSGSECLTEADANLTVKDYMDKLLTGLGNDVDCKISNLKGQHGNVSFRAECTALETPLSTVLDLSYDYTRDNVRIEGAGTVQGPLNFPIQITAVSQRKGPCEKAPIAEAELPIEEKLDTETVAVANAASEEPRRLAKAKPSIIYLNPSELTSYLKSKETTKPTVVHYSSTDRSCTHCLNGNITIEHATETLSDEFDFVQIEFNPWKSFAKTHKNLGGLPSITLYDGVVPIASLKGFKADMADQIPLKYEETQAVLNDEYKDVKIPQISSKQLKSVIDEERGEKVLVVHLTSQNADACPFCVKNNAFIRAAARGYSEQYEFMEISYEQVNALKADGALKDILTSYNSSASGLPVTLFFGKEGQFNKRQGVWPAILEDFKAAEGR